jgi:hypothetical protein
LVCIWSSGNGIREKNDDSGEDEGSRFQKRNESSKTINTSKWVSDFCSKKEISAFSNPI